MQSMMKKTLLLPMAVVGMLCLPTSGYARDINQGTIEIEGGSNLSIESSEVDFDGGGTEEVDSMGFSATALYYVMKNMGVGLTWSYDNTEFDDGVDTLEVTTNAIGPVASFNMSLNDQASVFVSGAVLMASTEIDDGASDTTIDGFGFQVGAGLRYFLNDAVALNGSLQYQSLSLEDDDSGAEADETGFVVGVGLSVFLK